MFDKGQKFKKNFIEIRGNISKLVRSCADNVKVVIHMNAILDDPIIVTAGKGENILLVTIHSETGVDYKWTKETQTKVFGNGWENARKVFFAFSSTVKGNLHKATLISLTVTNWSKHL